MSPAFSDQVVGTINPTNKEEIVGFDKTLPDAGSKVVKDSNLRTLIAQLTSIDLPYVDGHLMKR